MKINLRIPVLACILAVSACDFFYSPEKGPSLVDPGPGTGPTNPASEAGTIYSINPNKQICNESVSRDGVRFPACMLWLNFSGELKVTVPVSMEARWGDKLNAIQHDRLTITDTSNTVKWFIHMDEMGTFGQLQDPEWTTHPDYLTFLGSSEDYKKWSGMVVRTTDNKSLTLIQNVLMEQSTPHVWIGKNANPGIATNTTWDATTGIIDTSSITSYFGTREVKMTYVLKTTENMTLHYIDFSQPVPTTIKLNKPKGRERWNVENADISPDGNWVTYQMFENLTVYECYVQAIKEGSKPILLKEKASDPRWWIHPVDSSQYIVYTQIVGSYFVNQDLSKPEVADGSVGRTFKQKVKAYSPDLPEHLNFAIDGAPVEIAPLPFKGGLSLDGRFLATGYAYAYMLKLK